RIVDPVRLRRMAVSLYGKRDAVARMPEPRAETASTRKQIDRDRLGARSGVRHGVSTASAERDEYALPATLVLRPTHLAPMMNKVDVEPLPHPLVCGILERIIVGLASI